jgi:hypothetical protein
MRVLGAFLLLTALPACAQVASESSESKFCRDIADKDMPYAECMATIIKTPRMAAVPISPDPIIVLQQHDTSPAFQPMPNILPPPPVRCRSVPTGYGTYQTVCQ